MGASVAGAGGYSGRGRAAIAHRFAALVAAHANLTVLNELGETPLATGRRPFDECTTNDPHCPITQGVTDASVGDLQSVVAYLESVGG